MIRRIISFLLVLISIQTWSYPIDQQQAVENVKTFLCSQSRKGAKGIRAITRRNHEIIIEKASEVADAYFVFNIQGGGFVIAAADDRVPEVLGYADSGSFDITDIPDNMRGWLEGIAEEIQAIQRGEGEAAGNTETTYTSIAPMVTTHWRQGKGDKNGNAYNYMCPKMRSSSSSDTCYCLTGCVATAMAQVMKYHEWPKEACKTIPSYYIDIPGSTTLELEELQSIVFNWANMKSSYSNESETDVSAIAVAQLMRYCGQSVKMQYRPYGSSASTASISGAFKSFFDYDEGVHKEDRSYYTIEEWNDIIYRELAEARPVVLSGKSSGGGHAFVCDGYDADDYFHINWGWGGSKDGYFLLSVLNPYDNSGAGASTTRDGYSAENYAIVGIQPPTGNSYIPPLQLDIYGSLSFDGSTLDSPIWNTMGEQVTFDMGYAIKNEDGSLTIIESRSSKTLQDRYYTHFYFDLSKANLSDGSYTIFTVIKRPDDTEWKFLCKDCFIVTVKDGSIAISISTPTSDLSLSIEKSTLLTDGRSGFPQEISVTIVNSGKREFYGRLYLFLEGSDKYLACTGATVSAGKQSDISFFFTPSAGGTIRFWITTDEEGKNNIGEGTVSITNGIKVISDTTTEKKPVYYDLQGRKVDYPSKGIYIINNKKVIIK